MSAPYTGACACGAVTATIAGEPIAVRQCWCLQCQKAAGGSAAANAIFRTQDVTLSGALAAHGHTAASGNTLTRHWCPVCGVPVLAEVSARPHFRTFRLGFLAAGHGLEPDAVIWTSEAPDWAEIAPALAAFTHQPPPPPASPPPAPTA